MRLADQFAPSPPPKSATLAQHLAYERRRQRLKGRELAKLAGICTAVVYLAEKGEASYETQVKLGLLLGVRRDVLLAEAKREIKRHAQRVHAVLENAAA